MILSTLTVSCCKLCCKIEKISQKMAMSFKNCLSFDDRIFEFNHFSMLKMTGLDSFLTIWSDYLSCFVSLVAVVFAYLVILWISCHALNLCLWFASSLSCARVGLRPPSLLLLLLLLQLLLWLYYYYYGIYMFFCHDSSILWIIYCSISLWIHTNSNTNTNTNIYTYTLTHRISTWGWRRSILILHLHSLTDDIAQHEGEGETRIHLFNLQLRLYENIQ